MKLFKNKKTWKQTLIGAVALIAMACGAAFAAGNPSFEAAAQETETVTAEKSVYLNLNNNAVWIYPEYYTVDGVETAFSGTYVISGTNSNAKLGFVNDEGNAATYNVIFHDFYASNNSWKDVMGIDDNVTLNITARGENVVKGYNHPGIQMGEGEATVNITVKEKSSITFGANYSDQIPKSFANGITVNVLEGTPSVATTEEGWNE